MDPPRPTPRSMQLAGQLLAEHSEAATAAVPPIGDCDELTFTAEQCHRLAQALHDASGWEVVVVSDGPHGVAGWVHAGVRTPGGQILDVHGLQDEQLWIVDWAEHCDAVADGEEAYDRDDVGVFPATDHGWTPEHGWALGDSAPLYPDIEKRAAQVASLLLEQYRHAEAA
ncbi:hypothetical protein HNR08_003279 [Cellulomonas hominis]|uniref:Uncharacterized protein n=1 Tax=Cellulomonas hominis TaxID=156981 RepID=A0A7W8WC77_9CELL|nr:hypothetical protein [Cellulomonas hominis]MBB5474543.1 hypothetical protein [Cellulomonas hominis]